MNPINKKLTVTVGIPAHNEEHNLPFFLDSILRQRMEHFLIEKIIVVADGCTDKTGDIVKAYAEKNEKIQLAFDGMQKGKSQRLNEIYKMNESDVLITLDADTTLHDENFFEELLAPLKDPEVAVVAGNDQPLPGRTFIEKILVARNTWWYEARKNFQGGNNTWNSSGRSFALRKEFTKRFQFLPGNLHDEDIIYLQTLHQRKKFAFADRALGYYREAASWGELVIRAHRFEHKDPIKGYGFTFDMKEVTPLPLSLKLKGIARAFWSMPFYIFCSIFFALALKLVLLKKKINIIHSFGLWERTESTKELFLMKTMPGKEYSYKILHNLKEEERIEWQVLWEKSAFRHFFNSPSFFEACCEAFHIEKYAVIFSYQNGELSGVLPLQRDRVFGIKTWANPGRKGNYVDRSMLLVKEREEGLFTCLMEAACMLGNLYLAEVEEEFCNLISLKKNESIKEYASISRRRRLNADCDVLEYMPRRQRKTFFNRLKQRKNEIEFRMEGNDALPTVFEIERGSYHLRRHMAFFGSEQSKSFFRALMKYHPESIRIGTVFLQGKPVATNTGFVYGTTFCDYHTAFLEEYGSLGVGKMAFYFTFEYLKGENFTEIDFLRGNSELKKQFSEEIRKQSNLYFSKKHAVIFWWNIYLPARAFLKNAIVIARAFFKKAEVLRRSLHAFFAHASPSHTAALLRQKIMKYISEKKPVFRVAKVRIIFSNYDDQENPWYGGGGAIAIHQVARRLVAKFSMQVSVITGAYPLSQNKIIDGVSYERIGSQFFSPKIGQLIYHFLLPWNVTRRSFDVWIESFTPPFSTSCVPLFTSKPVIGLVHFLSGEDMQRKYGLPFQWPEKIGMQCYRYCIAISKSSQKKILSMNQRTRVFLIPNGVDQKNFFPQEGERKYILYLGRIEVNQKGLDLLLQAFHLIRNKTDVQLIIAGSGEEREMQKLRRLIREQNLEDRVQFVGRVIGDSEKMKLFHKAIAVAMSSRYETFSLVALEALSSGTPLVVFDIEGVQWIPDTIALKAPSFDCSYFSRLLLEVVKDKNKRERLAREGRVFSQQYDWDNIAKQYESVINNVLKK